MEIIITCVSAQSSINSTGEENLERATIEVEQGGKRPNFNKKKVKRQQGRDEKTLKGERRWYRGRFINRCRRTDNHKLGVNCCSLCDNRWFTWQFNNARVCYYTVFESLCRCRPKITDNQGLLLQVGKKNPILFYNYLKRIENWDAEGPLDPQRTWHDEPLSLFPRLLAPAGLSSLIHCSP